LPERRAIPTTCPLTWDNGHASAPQRTARIEDDVWDPAQARAKAEGASLGALMRAAVERYASGDLTSNAEPASQPHPDLTSHAQAASHPASQRASAAITVTGPGEPSPGVVCMGPGCWQRDTSRYGFRQLPLCPACCYQHDRLPNRRRVTTANTERDARIAAAARLGQTHDAIAREYGLTRARVSQIIAATRPPAGPEEARRQA
jgi:hypothetical protein